MIRNNNNIEFYGFNLVIGHDGEDGGPGKDGGIAGRSGSGGSASSLRFNIEHISGHLTVHLESGKGGDSLPHGYGGKGG